MSMSVDTFGQRLYFAAVLLVLLTGILVAVWLALFAEPEAKGQKISLPFFDYQAPENTSVYDDMISNKSVFRDGRDLFHDEAVAGTQGESLELHEVALGMIIVRGDKQFCLTNGVLLQEGDRGNGFTVYQVEANGVWYEIGAKKIFLRAGEKVNVDGEGNVRE